ncbi:glycosylphosphatidylinositol anchor attachment 1 protein-like [Ornithodoros turicata]|uniref:GPI-anchor transamidase component GPAA1 n=1 Tax=Ornithodoros turicata TaxID=34597 RepID=A0A2R5LE94_9ACAR
MGVLMNASRNSRLLAFVQKQSNKICFVSYLAGLVFFGVLAWDECNNKTYFSENALLPGLVHRNFHLGAVADHLLESLKEEAKDHMSLPMAWLQGQFFQLGLDVYTHNFSLHYPLGSKPVHTGENMYAILRAPRAASTEAVVLSIPYRTEDSLYGSTLPGIALMVAVAKYFRGLSYWAKDIIFLVTEHELVGFQAWLDAYHNVQSSPGVIDPGVLPARSGAIQAAINLELHSDRIKRAELKVLGLNGQLPNLDLFNLVAELCLRESVHTTFHDQITLYDSHTVKAWKHPFYTMLSMMTVQATGLPNGGHGLFHRYAIQSLTIEGHTTGAASTHVGFNEVGRVLEGVFCSLNNLLERFHQSFFFYLLPSTRRYVSIGLYSPAFALIAFPALVKAAVIFLALDSASESGNKSDKQELSPWSALPFLVFTHSIGVLLLVAPPYLDQLGRYFQFSSQESLYYGYLTCFLLTLLLPLFRGRNNCDRRPQRCTMLLIFGTVVFSLALVNISMATAVATLSVPVLVSAGTAKNWLLSLMHRLLLLLIHPFVLSFLLIFLQAMDLDSWDTRFIQNNLGHAFLGHKKTIMFSVEDWYLFGNWTFPICTLFFLPIWTQTWLL